MSENVVTCEIGIINPYDETPGIVDWMIFKVIIRNGLYPEWSSMDAFSEKGDLTKYTKDSETESNVFLYPKSSYTKNEDNSYDVVFSWMRRFNS